MKKNIKRFLAAALVLCFSVSAAGCQMKTTNSSGGSSDGGAAEEDVPGNYVIRIACEN